ncbi:pup3 [Symbiodinium natans]|uniref:Pup3 protein n=1 Tax=Symbiodinium natans TaxID=878477 RepID=A0A812J942_9DINO|nr:pup3 [Symbiodinium natans]
MSGLMEYNGSAIVAMAGDKCACDSGRCRVIAGVSFGLWLSASPRQKTFQVPEAQEGATGARHAASDDRQHALVHAVSRQKKVLVIVSFTLYEKRFGPWFTEPVVAGLDKEQNPFICGFDFIGCLSTAEDFVVSGTTSDQLFGVCESFWRPGMNKDELFETLSQCLLSGVDRDCLAGWGGVVHIITPDEIITKKLKGRARLMALLS